MRITESTLRQLIRETLLIEASVASGDAEYAASYEPTAPEGSPLGKYAFSPQRQMQTRPPPMERNKPVESALLKSIAKHFEGIRPLTRKQAEMAMGFIRDGLYPDVFREPPPGEYHRGMTLTIEDLESMGVVVPDTEVDGPAVEIAGRFSIRPIGDRFSSSWSYGFAQADEFSIGRRSEEESDIYSVIFTASTNDNPGKFIDAEGLYEVDMGTVDEFSHEREVIGLGTIIANNVRLMRVS